MFHRICHIILCALCLAPYAAYSGAWLQEKGESEFSLNTFYYETGEFFDLDGERQQQGLFTKYAIKPYFEHGLTDQWTVGGFLELQRVKQKQVGVFLSRENLGIADPEIFARRHLFDWKGGTFSIEPSIKFPSRFRDNRTPTGGTTSMEYGIALLHGQNFSLLGRNHYTDVRLEYVNRVAGLEDQYIAEVRAGLNVSDTLTIIPGLTIVESVDLPDNQPFVANGDIDFDLYKAELSAEYIMSDSLTLIAGANAHLAGRNTGADGGFNLGFRTRF